MMTPEEFWNSYCPGETAESFAGRCEDGNMRRAVAQYVEGLPQLYGIVRRLDWQHTFRNAPQYNRQEVVAGLMSYLELHHELWDKDVVPGCEKEYLSDAPHRCPLNLIATELDQRKSFEATMQQFTEKDPAPSAALTLINVGVDMPEMMLPDENRRQEFPAVSALLDDEEGADEASAETPEDSADEVESGIEEDSDDVDDSDDVEDDAAGEENG